jgi:hypothetical protein
MHYENWNKHIVKTPKEEGERQKEGIFEKT